MRQEALLRTPLVDDEARSSFVRRPERWRGIALDLWQSAHWQWQNRLRVAQDFEGVLALTDSEQSGIARSAVSFSVLVTPHYAALMRPELGATCPLRRQCIAHAQEFETDPSLECADPLGEESHKIMPFLTKRYPDRVLLYMSSECALRCRHCTRRRKVGIDASPCGEQIDQAIDYIGAHREIRDVLLSGGDPLSLSNERLALYLQRLRGFEHIDVIRLCTRMPVSMPQRIDDGLCVILQKFAPIYVQTHFNHHFELCTESEFALARLRGAGAILSNQSVLLRGVNDNAATLERLNRRLLRHGCRPYYLFNLDRAYNTSHFRVGLGEAMQIMETLRGRVTGLGVPQFVVDLPGGYGKVPMCPEGIVGGEFGGELEFRNWYGEVVKYWDG